MITDYIAKHGKDYRFEVSENPIPALTKRNVDDIEVGIVPSSVKPSETDGFKPL